MCPTTGGHHEQQTDPEIAERFSFDEDKTRRHLKWPPPSRSRKATVSDAQMMALLIVADNLA